MMETFAWRLLRGAGWPVRKNFRTRKKQSSERPSVIHQGVLVYIFLVQVKHGQTCESQCTHTRQVEVHRKTHTRTVADGMDNV